MSFIDEVYETDLQKEIQNKERLRNEHRAKEEAQKYTELIKNGIQSVHHFKNGRHWEVYLSSCYDNLLLNDNGKCFKKIYAEMLGFYLTQELEILGLKNFQVILEEIPEYEERGIIFKRKIKNYKYGTKIYIILDW